MHKNLTEEQKDYAVFLPALSGFYATFVGKQRVDNTYVDPARMPVQFNGNMESLNWLNPKEALFEYNWTLYSAGHAELDINKDSPKEDMIRNRDRKTSWLLGDSGGFQIGKGVWEGDWKDINCPRAKKKREQVLAWMDAYMDYGMILDIPAWVARSPAGVKATGISTYQEAVDATRINNDYFMKNRNGNCKFLNVLQGENHADADDWYEKMKDYCDPKVYSDHFNGWSMGGQNMCDIHLVLKRLVALRFDGLLEKGKHDFMHFLGTSKLEWATLLTDIQRAVRKYHNPNFTVTFDCASPFLATANGQIYCELETNDRQKWVYRMVPSIDNKAMSTDNTPFAEAFVREGKHPSFLDSPVTDGLTAKDICIYGPGDLNKIGKEGKTSWDSFSYGIMMGHNVWMHINAVQEANRQYDAGKVPNMLVQETFDKVMFRDIVEAIFATDDRQVADAIIKEYSKYWMSIIGTRGATGKKTQNASTMFNNLFKEA
tara:strand:- start:548 stop:2008 length:1461 start_codon:yes stop_codon:yes gene_type:complete